MCSQQRIDRDEIDALFEEHAAQLVDGLAGLDAPAIRPKHRELELHWRGDEKTIQQWVHRDLVMLAGSTDPTMDLIEIILQADYEHSESPTTENPLPGQILAPGCSRQQLQKPDRGLAGATGSHQPR